MRLEFDWDAIKALSNMRKHRVSFDEAMAIFLDPVALTIFDADHSDAEERWITVGRSKSDVLLLVVHTHVEVAEERVVIRIISARRPTRSEMRQYEEGARS